MDRGEEEKEEKEEGGGFKRVRLSLLIGVLHYRQVGLARCYAAHCA